LNDNGLSSVVNGGELQNENWVVSLKDDLSVATVRQMRGGGVKLFDEEVNPARNGFEDCRLIECDGRVFVLAAAHNAITCTSTMTLGRLEDHNFVGVCPLPSPLNCPREKNWMPFVQDGALHAVYSVNPMRINKDWWRVSICARTRPPSVSKRLQRLITTGQFSRGLALRRSPQDQNRRQGLVCSQTTTFRPRLEADGTLNRVLF
jgi:hypothetical protein